TENRLELRAVATGLDLEDAEEVAVVVRRVTVGVGGDIVDNLTHGTVARTKTEHDQLDITGNYARVRINAINDVLSIIVGSSCTRARHVKCGQRRRTGDGSSRDMIGAERVARADIAGSHIRSVRVVDCADADPGKRREGIIRSSKRRGDQLGVR